MRETRREMFADFMGLERLPDGRRRLRLGRRTIQQEGLHPGDQVLLIEYGSLRAPAVMVCVPAEDGAGAMRWYGELTGAIEELDTPLPSQPPVTPYPLSRT